ncbi:TetR/AcrR family transcriptional regulator [Paraburkholderia aspalathi]|uniref:Transcriptional regulator, TetR family n=1 Tax=Paraburkholderia aspalathi TaxID=1324617 RepID=A0A1I7ERR0_9BURK|nr:TetR/AcrR family transcriptional regulator [Paraburkholderia aspalathi]SFU26590.1 transcriptional regulator, TetR family [Paraburkholderia aspalathi]
MARPSVSVQIFASALKLFHEKGFNASSVQDITEDAGMQKGSLYNHYGSKEDLAAKVIDHYGRLSERHSLLADESVAPLDRLDRYFQALNKMVTASAFARGCLLGNFSAELPSQSLLIREHLSAIYSSWMSAIEKAVTGGQADGSITRELPARQLATALLGAREGAALRAKVGRDHNALSAFMSVILRRTLA